MYYLREKPYYNCTKDFNNLFSNDGKTDIIENENDYVVKFEVAGVNKEDIKIEIEDDTLMIEATKKTENENKKYLIKERSFKNIKRTFYLNNMDENDVKAKYEDGILTIVVKKATQDKTKKTIMIE